MFHAYFSASWDALEAPKIVNCFKHCGFVTSEAENADVELVAEYNDEADFGNLWDRLVDHGLVPDDVTFDDYANLDAQVFIPLLLTAYQQRH